jgi:hypothetical protein
MAKAGRARLAVLVLLVVFAATLSSCSGGDDGGSSDVSAGSSSDGDGGNGEVKADSKRRQIAAGDGGAATAGEIVAKSADEWAQKWTASGATAPPPDVSGVDFASEVAVGLFAGEKPSGGWRIGSDITVKLQGQFGAVVYEILGPGEGCSSTQALTTPYLVLAVKGSTMRFESSERLVDCKD